MDARTDFMTNEWNHYNQPARTAMITDGLWSGKPGSELVDLWQAYFNEFLEHSWLAGHVDSYWVLRTLTADALANLMLYDEEITACYVGAGDFRRDILKAYVAATAYVTRYSTQRGWL